MQLTDEELVDKIRKEDKELFSDLVKRYEDKLMQYAVFLIHDEQKAMDVVQDSFIKSYKNLNGFYTNKKFSSWIFRIVHNEAMNKINKYKKEFPIRDDLNYESKEDLEENFSKKEIMEMAHECLDKIPVIYKEPLVLSYFEEKSYGEVSEILRIPMGTVSIRIKRAKELMKKICQK